MVPQLSINIICAKMCYVTKNTDKQISAKLYDFKKNDIYYSLTVQKILKRLKMAPKGPPQFQNEQSSCCRI